MQSGFQEECWRSAERWCTLISLGNEIEEEGAKSLAGVLGQCAALTRLDFSNNQIESAGAESFAGVLGQCASLAHLDLQDNDIDAVGEGRLRASWRGQASGLLL